MVRPDAISLKLLRKRMENIIARERLIIALKVRRACRAIKEWDGNQSGTVSRSDAVRERFV